MATLVPVTAPWSGLTPSRYVFGRFLYSNGAAAGVHTLAWAFPLDTVIFDVGVTSRALWNQGTSAALIAGDADDPDGFLASIDCKATDLLAYESISIRAGTALAGGKIGAYIANSQWGKGSGTYGQFSPAVRTITFTLTTDGTAATTGDLYCWIEFLNFSGSEPVAAGTYVAS